MKRNFNIPTKIAIFLLLHLIFLIYSISSIFGKYASGESFLSLRFCLFYFLSIFLLGFYALAWQQILKYMPLTIAYTNRAVTTVWGVIWGVVLFKERITPGKIVGLIMVCVGIYIYSRENEDG